MRGYKAYVVKRDQLISPAAIIVTNCKENAVPRDGRYQLLQKKEQEYPAYCGQVEVMDLEQAIELHRLPALHELPSAEDDQIV